MSYLNTKGMLAKLLATENLHIEHDASAKTAAFDTENRVLSLPVLMSDNEHVYNMFVAHEVGHALHTPHLWKDEIPAGIPFDYVNVIEDVRIERLIQQRFPGLRVDFTRGYENLDERDFFELDGVDTAKLSLIDRINIHFKLGALALVPFSDEEQVYVKAVDEADTWQKVLLVAKMIQNYIQEKAKENQPEPTQSEGQGGGESEGQPTSNSNPSQSDEGESGSDSGEEEGDEGSPQTTTNTGGGNSSTTQEAFDRNMEREATHHDMQKYLYVEALPPNLSEFVTPVSKVAETTVGITDLQQEAYQNFINNIKSDVNFMVQQFEMKKSADAYARASIHKTGVLNTNQLHNYQLTDDVFLRHTVVPDGKNHGMVLLIDWSGSMQNVVADTVKQVITLVQFCRKAQIPFEVYTFTTGYKDPYAPKVKSTRNIVDYSHCEVVQVLSSSRKNKDINQDMKNLFCVADTIQNRMGGGSSPYLVMGGTPLQNVLFGVPALIKQFKKNTGAQKVSFVCLTDGASSPVTFIGPSGCNTVYWENLMVRIKGETRALGNCAENTTGDIISWFKELMPDVTFSHLFLGGKAGCTTYAAGYGYNLDTRVFNKEGMNVFTDSSWDVLGVINPRKFTDTADDMEVEEGATKTQIRNALKKFLKQKSNSRLLLRELVGQFS